MGRVKKRKVHHDPGHTTFLDDNIEALFHKCYTYQHPAGEKWTLPPTSDLFSTNRWSLPDLQKLANELNSVKNLLSEIDIVKWHAHTRNTHRAGLVIGHIKAAINPELCTQAWCKFSEILRTFPTVLPGREEMDGAQFRSVHLCEAPGAFITALNHYINTTAGECEWSWVANTLNPYYEGNSLHEMIDDDRLITNSLSSWYFGEDNTGNIMSADNIQGLVERLHQQGPVHLVTADGSIDCADDPAHQEPLTSQLHYCELIAAVHLLSPGGSLVLKMFTLVEDSSICLMFLLNCLFSQVDIFKPTTSKPGNSEVYIIARHFLGLNSDVKEKLLKFVGPDSPQHSMFPLVSIPTSFLDQHKACCAQFMTWQRETILNNLALYQDWSPAVEQQVMQIKQCFLDLFMKKFTFKKMENSKRIIPRQDRSHANKKTKHLLPTHRHVGTYTERQQRQLSWQQRVSHQMYFDCEGPPVVWTELKDVAHLADFSLVTGRRLTQVVTSLYCDKELLEMYNDYLKNSEFLKSSRRYQPGEFVEGFESIVTEMLHFSTPPGQCEADKAVMVRVADTFNGSFGKFLQNEQFAGVFSSSQSSDSSPCIHILEDDSTLSSTDTEHHSTLHPLSLLSIKTQLQSMHVGDHLVIRSGPLFTRLSASVVYLLQTIFVKVGICYSESGSADFLYIACISLQQDDAELERQLDALSSSDATNYNQSQSVLSFLPSSILKDPALSHFLLTVNNLHLKRRLNFLLQEEREIQEMMYEIGLGRQVRLVDCD